MNNYKFLLLLLFIIIFSCVVLSNNPIIEGFSQKTDCPDVLIQKGKKLFLFNQKKAKVPGVNPIEFNNLEEYGEFVKWSKSRGINCPVLFLQQSFDVQGTQVYAMRPGPNNLQGGFPTKAFDSVNNLNVVDEMIVSDREIDIAMAQKSIEAQKKKEKETVNLALLSGTS
tara:strand:+ start:231 stop:737 length:507 start_codon:yes stop_codon:yes gene_type:complete